MPNSEPAMPAMAADMQKTTSLLRRTSRPSVAHAASLSRIAASRRPNGPRRSASTLMPSPANTMPAQHEERTVAGEVDAEDRDATDLDVLGAEDAAVVEDQVVGDDRDRERHEREVKPCRRMAGQRDDDAERDRDRGGRDEAEDVVARRGADGAHRPRTEPEEDVLREGDLAAVAGEQHERQHQRGEDEALRDVGQVVADEGRHDQRAPARNGRDADERRPERRDPRRVAPDDATDGQASLREQQQRGEQEQALDARADVGPELGLRLRQQEALVLDDQPEEDARRRRSAAGS